MKNNLVVGYVAGLSFSGSTLLARLMAYSTEVFSCGELHNQRNLAARGLLSSRTCSCGEPWPCEFWRAVDREFIRDMGFSFIENPVAFDEGNDAPPDEYVRRSIALYRSLSKISRKSVFFDVGKRPQVLSLLLAADDLDVRPIHLIRHPFGNVFSMMKNERHGLRRAARNYTRDHSRTIKALKGLSYIRIHYEDLATETERVLGAIADHLGIARFKYDTTFQPTGYHGLDGRPRESLGTEGISLNEDWRESLNLATTARVLFHTRKVRQVYSR